MWTQSKPKPFFILPRTTRRSDLSAQRSSSATGAAVLVSLSKSQSRQLTEFLYTGSPIFYGHYRLLGFIGPEGDEARAILREIRNHQAQAISAAGKRVAGPTPLQQPLSSAFQSISPVASFFGSHSSSQDYHSPRSTMRKVFPCDSTILIADNLSLNVWLWGS